MPRGKRLAHSVVVAILLVALLAGVVSVIGAVGGRRTSPPSASDPLAPIDGYPQRIGFERPSPALPDRPGALAATLYDNNFGDGRALGVTSRGRLWELPPGINVLSPDGRVLLTGQSSGHPSRLSVHDLSTGDRRVFDDITQALDTQERRAFLLDPNGPVFWSESASAVLARFSEHPHRNRYQPRVLDVGSGALVEVAGGEPAGFRSPSDAVTVSKVGGTDASGGITATTTDLETGETQGLPLRLAGPWGGDPDSDLVASVSPDGTTLLLVEVAEGEFPDATLRLFSLTDGSELTPRTIRDWDGCSPVWLGDDPLLPTKSQAAGSELVTANDSRSLVAVHHRLQSRCLQLTADALTAGPHRALFGTWTYLWTWYWWPLLLACSLALLALAWFLWCRQRRKA